METETGRVLPAEEVGPVEDWVPPSVEEGVPDPACAGPMTARDLERVRQQAQEQGYAAGYQQGMQVAQREMALRLHRLDQLLEGLARPLAELDEAVERNLVALAMAVARQVIRRELRADPGQVLAAIREATAVLPLSDRELHVHLHPDDAALVRQALSLGEEPNWTLVEDPVMTRGGCRIVSGASEVDATVERRIQAVVASVLGDERGPTEAGA